MFKGWVGLVGLLAGLPSVGWAGSESTPQVSATATDSGNGQAGSGEARSGAEGLRNPETGSGEAGAAGSGSAAGSGAVGLGADGSGNARAGSEAAGAAGLVREEKSLQVAGVEEVWRLQWRQPPQPACPADDEVWFTCPCSGFAFGERGVLDLVRLRQGQEIERLALAPLFEATFPEWEGQAIVQRWQPVDGDADHETPDLQKIRARPTAEVLKFGDYDHDGQATEFLLQVATEPCGKRMMVAVGLAPGQARLHTLGTAEHPDQPLVLRAEHWESLRQATQSLTVETWQCGDHDSPVQELVVLRTDVGGLHARREIRVCRDGTPDENPIREDDL